MSAMEMRAASATGMAVSTNRSGVTASVQPSVPIADGKPSASAAVRPSQNSVTP